MATHRYISTTFWDDAWIQGLDPEEKFIYLYLMTNPLTSISGVYKITDRRISFDTGHDEGKIRSVLEKFGKARKAIRMGEYIVLPSWPKHQSWETMPKIRQGIISDLNKLGDDELRLVYASGYKFPMGDLLKKRNIEASHETNGDTVSIPYTDDTHSLSETMDSLSEDTHRDPINSFYSDSNLNLEFIGNSNAASENSPVDNLGKKRPPPKELYIFIKDSVKAHGFYIDEPVAKKIAKSIPDPAWFTADHSIIDLVAEKINDIYSDKPKEERKKLFVSALTKWENIQDEYPDWLNKKIEADKNRALERLRNTPPPLCPKCQADMGGKRACPNCKGMVLFDDDKRAWVYEEPVDFSSFGDIFRQQKKEKANSETAPPSDEDIEF